MKIIELQTIYDNRIVCQIDDETLSLVKKIQCDRSFTNYPDWFEAIEVPESVEPSKVPSMMAWFTVYHRLRDKVVKVKRESFIDEEEDVLVQTVKESQDFSDNYDLAQTTQIEIKKDWENQEVKFFRPATRLNKEWRMPVVNQGIDNDIRDELDKLSDKPLTNYLSSKLVKHLIHYVKSYRNVNSIEDIFSRTCPLSSIWKPMLVGGMSLFTFNGAGVRGLMFVFNSHLFCMSVYGVFIYIQPLRVKKKKYSSMFFEVRIRLEQNFYEFKLEDEYRGKSFFNFIRRYDRMLKFYRKCIFQFACKETHMLSMTRYQIYEPGMSVKIPEFKSVLFKYVSNSVDYGGHMSFEWTNWIRPIECRVIEKMKSPDYEYSFPPYELRTWYAVVTLDRSARRYEVYLDANLAEHECFRMVPATRGYYYLDKRVGENGSDHKNKVYEYVLFESLFTKSNRCYYVYNSLANEMPLL